MISNWLINIINLRNLLIFFPIFFLKNYLFMKNLWNIYEISKIYLWNEISMISKLFILYTHEKYVLNTYKSIKLINLVRSLKYLWNIYEISMTFFEIYTICELF